MAAEELRQITTDVVVVGSGAGGLLAAATLRQRGIATILVESTDMVGGSSAMSGGALWLPCNPLMGDLGVTDSPAEALEYLDACLGPERPGSTAERRRAYVETAPELLAHLQGLGLEMEAAKGYPDYYPELPGGRVQGRSVECKVTDSDVLGEWRKRCRFTIPLALKGSEAPAFATSLRSVHGFLTAAKVVGWRAVGGGLTGKHLVAGGAALVTGLVKAVLDSGAGLWLDSPMREITRDDDGRVNGVVIERNGVRCHINARRGVLLAAGGFERNQAMREEFLPQPTDARWSSGNEGNQGDAVRLGMELGAATYLLDDAWWGPSFLFADGTSHFALWERTLPHSIIVDRDGRRYFNEAKPYAEAGQDMYAHDAGSGNAVPSYLILDNRHRSRYPLGTWLPGMTPKAAVLRGDIVKARSIQELAAGLGIDEAGLIQTVVEFNVMAKKGTDTAFHRGESAYDRYYADPSVKPNPSLGTIEKGPFWGIRIHPGDLGTKGGLVTDVDGRVLATDGSPIEGLFATGNCTASVMARSYPGAGGTLGPACLFGYRAALALAEVDPR